MRDLVRTALAAAEAAARVHVELAGRIAVDGAREKRGSDFVTEVDLASQEAALDVIRESFPGHRILAEEEGGGVVEGDATRGDDDTPLWVVDPLDGTTNFLHGHPAYCASVGVMEGGEAVAGAVVAAATGERWWGGRGAGAYRNGWPIRVSGLEGLGRALVGTGFPFKDPALLPEYLGQLDRVLRGTAGVRRGGSAALDLCYLAQGSLDAFWELWLSPWDVAGGLAILAAAGGVSSRVDGSPLDPREGGTVLAANSREMLELLRQMLDGGA